MQFSTEHTIYTAEWSDKKSFCLEKAQLATLALYLGWSWQWNQRYISDVLAIFLSLQNSWWGKTVRYIYSFFCLKNFPPIWHTALERWNFIPIRVWWYVWSDKSLPVSIGAASCVGKFPSLSIRFLCMAFNVTLITISILIQPVHEARLPGVGGL